MSFSRFFKLQTALLAIFVGASFAAKSQTGKVHYAVGEVFVHRGGSEMVIKSNDPDKNKLKKAKSVKERDDIITQLESEVTIGLPDGSSFNVQEKTVVSITKLSFEDGENNFVTEVKRGSMKFDVQKQANGKSKFKFKTGTATAAIRGTDGFVGTSKSCSVASLSTGSLEFAANDNEQATHSISGGQTIIYCKKDFLVMDLKSSGNQDLFKAIDSVLTDTTLSADAIRKATEEADKKISEKQNALKAKIQCNVTPLPDVVHSAEQTIVATCTEGTHIRIFDEPVLSDGSEIQLVVKWAASTVGPKKFPLTCFYGNDSTNTIQCGLVTTYYAGNQEGDESSGPVPLTITSNTPVEVCDPAMATIEGVFDPSDSNATLTVKLGKYTSNNLVPLSANGKFSHSISVSDKAGNWNENAIVINYESENGDQSATVPLKVNKGCKTVNLLPPTLAMTANKCKVWLELGQTTGDRAIYTLSVDGLPQKNVYIDSDRQFNDKLSRGTHNYTFHVEDLAGNHVEINKKLECYPPIRNAKIVIDGGDGLESVPVPPPPPKGVNSKIHRQLSFTIAGLPQNDPDYIREIKIAYPGKTIIIRGSDMLSNRIDQQIELKRGTTIVKITVKLKSGEILTKSKPYKV